MAAFATWHDDHQLSLATLRNERPVLIAHVALETLSVLTRLPPPNRVRPGVVVEFLSRHFPGPPLTPSQRLWRSLLGSLADLHIRGGAVYDALIALTAGEAGAELISLDRRAAQTYERCGVPFRILGG